MEFPQVEFSQVEFPQVEFPQVEFPQVRFPQVRFPQVPHCKFFLVGGVVRDLKLGKNKPKDLDYLVITNLTFSELSLQIESLGGVIFEAKPEFMTIRCKFPDLGVIDIVYPRIDLEYLDGRRPSGVKQIKYDDILNENTIEDILRKDAERRDLTINSMFLSDTNEIFDFYHGEEDLENRIIRTVGPPEDRFNEDYNRILRAARFSITLGFDIEPDTLTAMKLYSAGLYDISADRIRDELNKCLIHDPMATFSYVQKLKLDPILVEKGLNFQLTSKHIK